MIVTIFGGGGFIGSAIVDRLLGEGYTIRIFERPRVQPYRKFKDAEIVQWLVGDLSSVRDVSDAVQGADAVLHLVSTTLPKNSNEDPIYDVQSNVIPSLHILNAMVSYKVRNIIFISSGGTVYGNPLYSPIDEMHPTNPLVSYGITKLAIEKYLQVYERVHGIKAITLRVANPYGARQRVENAQGAIGVFLNNALKGIPIQIWGDGSVMRDYIYVSDVAEAFFKALHYQGEHRLFNVGSGVGTSLNKLIGEIEEILGKSIDRNYLPGRAFDVQTNILCNNLAQTEFSWRPIVSTHDGIKRTSEWMKMALVF